ncbi:hypothetical protein [Polaromonas sp. JS666]|uniref:hypothetical protein n=1 Tax=Polaromonas sp. (strain JS666 / ATCC BAA-500) TaxID=296591 RepID=UPI0000464B4A|nr:hypothetical protein [Polaromonas sp. JS666]ABE45663.1 hypothetical protein Bpro_3764 [Polaromonas sp. JS666]
MTHQLFIEIFATACGLLGSLVLSLKGTRAAWGWLLFAMSNVGWLGFSFENGHWFMFIQQIGFSITSALGMWNWLIVPAIERRYERIVKDAVGGL